jgi:hypothetical protein
MGQEEGAVSSISVAICGLMTAALILGFGAMHSVTAKPMLSHEAVTEIKAKHIASKEEAEITAALAHWQQSWMSKNLPAYFAHYVDTFSGAADKNLTAKKWRKSREKIMMAQSNIVIELEDASIKMVDATHAKVLFKQHYKSSAYTNQANKSIQLIKINNIWLIESEEIN